MVEKKIKQGRGAGVPLRWRGLLLILSILIVFNSFPLAAFASDSFNVTRFYLDSTSTYYDCPFVIRGNLNGNYGFNCYLSNTFTASNNGDLFNYMNSASSDTIVKIEIQLQGNNFDDGKVVNYSFFWGGFAVFQETDIPSNGKIVLETTAGEIKSESWMYDFYMNYYINGVSEYNFGIRSFKVSFSQTTNGLIGSVIDWLRSILTSIQNLPSNISGFFSSLGDRISGFFSSLSSSLSTWWTNLTTTLNNFKTSVQTFFVSLGDRISGFFTDLWDDILYQVVPPDNMGEMLQTDINDLMTENLGFIWQLPYSIIDITSYFVDKFSQASLRNNAIIFTIPQIDVPLIDGTRVTIFTQKLYRMRTSAGSVVKLLELGDSEGNGFQTLMDFYNVFLSVMWIVGAYKYTMRFAKKYGFDYDIIEESIGTI